MIQIDDSGSGSLVGGTGIGVYRTETSEYIFAIIPIETFQGSAFKEKIYQKAVTKLIEKIFKQLKVDVREKIEVCQGYVFDDLRIWLSNNNYSWSSTRIIGNLQDLVEQSFTDYIIGLGLPKNFVKHARYAFGFHRLLKWVLADFDDRQNLCKTGWKSWQKWSVVNKSVFNQILYQQDYCLKCGKLMHTGTAVTTLEYTTLKPSTINLHRQCYTGKFNEVPPQSLHEIILGFPVSKITRPLEHNDNLLLKQVADIIYLSKNNENLLPLAKDISSKIIFWQDKNFQWRCEIIEINANKIKASLKLICPEKEN